MATYDFPQQTAVYQLAVDVFDSEEDAQQFMSTPHPLLQGTSPLMHSLTEGGARQVMELLERLRWGLSR